MEILPVQVKESEVFATHNIKTDLGTGSGGTAPSILNLSPGRFNPGKEPRYPLNSTIFVKNEACVPE